MSRWALALAASATLAAPFAWAQDRAAPREGETIRIAEGWYRIEPAEAEIEGFLGTLKVDPPPSYPPSATYEERETQVVEKEPGPLSRRKGAVSRCRREQARYMEELFRIAGIWHFPQALTLVTALDATPGIAISPWVRFNLFGVSASGSWSGSPSGVDPIRPLAWDEGLRWAADDLIRCASGGRLSPGFR